MNFEGKTVLIAYANNRVRIGAATATRVRPLKR
jgi:hypothetical protein